MNSPTLTKSRRALSRRVHRAVLWLLCASMFVSGMVHPAAIAQPPAQPPIPPRNLAPQPKYPAPPINQASPPQQPITHSESGSSQSLQEKLRRRGNLILNEATLREALFSISETWKVNIVVGEEIQGKVDGVFKDAPLHEILHSLLFANNYSYRVVGESIVIVSAGQLGDTNPMMETLAIRLNYIKAEDAVAGATILKSPQGKVQSLGESKSILVVDLPERIAAIKQFILEVDRPIDGSTDASGLPVEARQFALQYMEAKEAMPAIQAALSKTGQLAALERENKLVVVDQVDKLRLIEQLIERIDQPRKQVRITAYIYDVSISDMEKLGINLNQSVQGRYNPSDEPQTLWSIDSLMTVPAAAGDPSSVMTLMNMSRTFDITAAIHALNSCGNSRLLADPTVVVVDREEASIQIVTEIPYQQLTQTQQGGAIGTTAFRDAGVTLNVTPQIANDGTIQMNVTPIFSTLAGFTQGATPQPIINKREANTTVRVANGQTLVLGGLRQRSENFTKRGIPYLNNLHYLGKLFRGHETDIRESELVVLITPEISTPYATGAPREEIAGQVTQSTLGRIPVAHDCYAPQHAEGYTPGPGETPHGAPGPDIYPPANGYGPSGQPGQPGQPHPAPYPHGLQPEQIPAPSANNIMRKGPEIFEEPKGRYDDRFTFSRRGELPSYVRETDQPAVATQPNTNNRQVATTQPPTNQPSSKPVVRVVRPLTDSQLPERKPEAPQQSLPTPNVQKESIDTATRSTPNQPRVANVPNYGAYPPQNQNSYPGQYQGGMPAPRFQSPSPQPLQAQPGFQSGYQSGFQTPPQSVRNVPPIAPPPPPATRPLPSPTSPITPPVPQPTFSRPPVSQPVTRPPVEQTQSQSDSPNDWPFGKKKKSSSWLDIF